MKVRTGFILPVMIFTLSTVGSYLAAKEDLLDSNDEMVYTSNLEQFREYQTELDLNYSARIYKDDLESLLIRAEQNGLAIYMQNAGTGGELVQMGSSLGKSSGNIVTDALGGEKLPIDMTSYLTQENLEQSFNQLLTRNRGSLFSAAQGMLRQVSVESVLLTNYELDIQDREPLNLSLIKEDTRYLVLSIMDRSKENLLGFYVEELGVELPLALATQLMQYKGMIELPEVVNGEVKIGED